VRRLRRRQDFFARPRRRDPLGAASRLGARHERAFRSRGQISPHFSRARDRQYKRTLRVRCHDPHSNNQRRQAIVATRAMLAVTAILDKIPQSLISLAARIFPAAVFWRSGQTKVEGFHITDSAIDLFRDEYALR